MFRHSTLCRHAKSMLATMVGLLVLPHVQVANAQVPAAVGPAPVGGPRGHAGLTTAPRRHAGRTATALETAGDAMADIQEHLDEYGYITVSTPLLSRPDDRFTYGLDRSAATYFDEAKKEVQGGAAVFEQRAFSLAVAASVQQSPEEKERAEEERARCRELRARADERMETRREAAFAQHRADMVRAGQEADPAKRGDLEAAAAKRLADALKAAEEPDPCPTATTTTQPTTGTGGTTSGGTTSQGGGQQQDTDMDMDGAPEEFAGNGEFRAFQGFLKEMGVDPTLSNRAAIIQSAGDRAVQAIFNVLGDPGDAQRFADRVTLLGVSTVSVAPGWRTRTGFAADVSVAVELSYARARAEIVDAVLRDDGMTEELKAALRRNHGFSQAQRETALPEAEVRSREGKKDGTVTPGERASARTKIERDASAMSWSQLNVPARLVLPQALGVGNAPVDRPVPVVTSVSPMTEAQNLDLAASFRTRTSISLALSFLLRSSGMNAQADAFQKFVKQREVDIATRTPDVQVASFGASHLFGYQVGPALRAIGDAASRKPKPRMELGRQTFPVLIICGFSREDLQPICGLEQAGEGDKRPDGERIFLFEPQLRFSQTPRWVPIEKKSSRDDLEEDHVMHMARRLDEAQPQDAPAARASGQGSSQLDRAARMADMRIEEMWGRAFGTTAVVTMPKELILDPAKATVPRVDFLKPAKIEISEAVLKDKPTVTLNVHGAALDKITDIAEVLRPKAATGWVSSADPIVRAFTYEVTEAGTALFKFSTGTPPAVVAALPFEIIVRKEPPAQTPTKTNVAALTVERDASKGITRVAVEVQPGATDATVAEALKLLGASLAVTKP